MSDQTLRQAVEEAAFCAGLPADMRSRLAVLARLRRGAAGTVLFRAGERSDDFYLVHRGHVALDMNVPGRGTVRLLTIGEGEILAWSAVVADQQMTATATAVDDVELLAFSGSQLRQWCETDPAFGHEWMRRLASTLGKRLMSTRLQMLDLFHADADASRGGVA